MLMYAVVTDTGTYARLRKERFEVDFASELTQEIDPNLALA